MADHGVVTARKQHSDDCGVDLEAEDSVVCYRCLGIEIVETTMDENLPEHKTDSGYEVGVYVQ
jgi:hypothetical protein